MGCFRHAAFAKEIIQINEERSCIEPVRGTRKLSKGNVYSPYEGG